MVRLSTALAQFILAISYVWAISTLNSYRHKRFSLSFYNFCVGSMSAGLGVLRYGNPLMETSLMKPDEKVIELAHTMYPTVVAIELLLLHWPETFQTDYVVQIIVFTCIIAGLLWLYENQSTRRKWSLHMLKKKMIQGSAFSVSLALVVSILNHNMQGTVASIFIAVNTVFIGTRGCVFDMPARDLYSYVQCFCNYHVVRALMD